MRSRITYRLIIFILALVFGIFFSMPSFTGSQNGQKVSLGLDLQGGLYMLLSVQTDAAITSKIKSIASAIKYDTDKNDILVDRLKADESGISIALLDSDDAKKLDENTYFIVDLIGLSVYDEQENKIGILDDIFSAGSRDVYAVKTEDGKQILLPAISKAIKKIDIEQGKIIVDVSQGVCN